MKLNARPDAIALMAAMQPTPRPALKSHPRRRRQAPNPESQSPVPALAPARLLVTFRRAR